MENTKSILDQVKNVSIDYAGGYKFIVAKVYNTNNETESKLVVRANKAVTLHRNILRVFQQELPDNIDAYCIGGGYIKSFPQEKTIRIWGTSGDFGKEPDRSETIKLLQNTFPEWNITTY